MREGNGDHTYGNGLRDGRIRDTGRDAGRDIAGRRKISRSLFPYKRVYVNALFFEVGEM